MTPNDVQLLSDRYSHLLGERLTANQMTKVRAGQAYPDDYVDSNQMMLDAFLYVFGRDMRMPGDAEEGHCTEAEADHDAAMASGAFSESKAKGYTVLDRWAAERDAFKKGKKIEYWNMFLKSWNVSYPSWTPGMRYRIKPVNTVTTRRYLTKGGQVLLAYAQDVSPTIFARWLENQWHTHEVE